MKTENKVYANFICPLCQQQTGKKLTEQLRRGVGRVFHCAKCNHGFLIDNKIDDLKSFYANTYRNEYSHYAQPTETNPREIHEVYKKFQKERLNIIIPQLRFDGDLLEVGASAGQFLIHVKELVREVNAIELDTACVKFLIEQLDINSDAEYLEKSRFANCKYDFICAFQVMEHVVDPIKFLQSLKEVIKPGGLIFIEVPNLYDPLMTVWNVPSYHTFYYHSAHLHYFTEASLRIVVKAAGFSAKSVDFHFLQDYNLLNQLHWIMNDSPQADCQIGLNDIHLSGLDKTISSWLDNELQRLNQKYIELLRERKSTSNILMVIKNDG